MIGAPPPPPPPADDAAASPPKERAVSRREAREAAMFIVLSSLTLHKPAAECLPGIASMLEEGRQQRALRDMLTREIVHTFDDAREGIDAQIAACRDYDLTLMTVMERAIISAATAELRARPDTPPKVVLNEYIELAKRFGAEGGNTLVNGVLDAIIKQPS